MDKRLLERYLARGEDWPRLCDRVSGIMMYSDDREEIRESLLKLRWLPNSPCLVNAGKPGGRNLAACHLLEVENSIEGIFEAVKSSAMVFKSGGGLGLEFSNLSPAGDPLRYAPGGLASGPVSFMKVFDAAARVVMEGGLRRAAIMGTLNVAHPDIFRFISAKEHDRELSNFNLSVTIDGSPNEVDLDVWEAVVNHAHLNGEPGVVFLKHINDDNPTLYDFGKIKGVNACSELALYSGESCILASLNLVNVVEKVGDWELLEKCTGEMVRFLNRVIDVNHYPLPCISQQTRKVRRIGIGVMGWADLLDRDGIVFASKEANELASLIGEVIYNAADKESWELAAKDGGYLPDRRRNVTLFAIAPTGHIARLAGVSHSIYPEYGFGLRMTGEQHLDHIATWQKWVDNAVSYTVSFTSDKPVSFVDRVFRGAYERGLKAISVYRDGSREGQPCKVEGVCDV